MEQNEFYVKEYKLFYNYLTYLTIHIFHDVIFRFQEINPNNQNNSVY